MTQSAFSKWYTHQQQTSFLLSLFHTLQYARQEAITRQTIIRVTPLSANCIYQWQYGIKIVIGNFSTKEPLKILQDPAFHNLSSNQPCGFQFMPDGRCVTPGTLTLYSPSGDTQRIVINDSGRLRLKLAERA